MTNHERVDSPNGQDASVSRPLHIGLEWFPEFSGGLNRYLRDLFESQQAAGLSPRVVVVGPGSDAPEAVRLAGEARQPLLRRMLACAAAVGREINDADLVDAHFAPYALRAVLDPRARRLPLVVHFQGPWAGESAAEGETGWKVAAKRSVERLVYRRADQLVVLCPDFRRILVEHYGVQPWRIRVVPPGVNLQRFTPGSRSAARRRLGLPREAFIAVTVRRLVARVGVDVLLESWARVARPDGPTSMLVVVGEGPAGARLRAQARQLGIADQVRFTGRVADEDLVAVNRAADVAVIPSTALEGFGLATLEALACGTPTVVTDVGGLPTAVQGLDRGLIVPGGDAAALADRLSAAMDGTRPFPDREACRAHAETFAWPEIVGTHQQVYQRAARKARDDGRLRVVYLDHCARLSGAELALTRLVPAMAEQIQAHVILGEDGPLVQRLQAAGASVEVLPMAEAGRGLTRDQLSDGAMSPGALAATAAYTVRLARRLRRLSPDLVHANSLKACLYGSLAARLGRVPVVWHARDRIAADYLPPTAVRITRAAARSLPTAVLANSKSTLHTLRLPARTPRAVIGDPVDLNAFPTPGDPEVRTDVARVGMLGRLADWKGQHVFLEAFARAFGDTDVQAALIGTDLFGDDSYERRLHELAARLGIVEQVEFRGHRDDVAGELERLDILVHASTVPEPFGQVVVEGMAAGLPVVAADAGGPAEIIEDGTTGLLSPPGDVPALAKQLSRLAETTELRARLASRAPEAARAFEAGCVGRAVVDFYGDVLGTNHTL